jgi:hypothetical protein
MALVGTRRDGALPLLGRKLQVDLYRLRNQSSCARTTSSACNTGAVLTGGLEAEFTHHSEEDGAIDRDRNTTAGLSHDAGLKGMPD